MNRDIVLKIYKRTVLISFLLIGFSAFVLKDSKPFILGYIFGVIVSMLSLQLLNNTINKAIYMSPGKASGYSTMHYFLRFTIYFIVLVVAALADYLNFPAAAIGLLMVKFVIFMSTIFDKNFH